MHVVNHLVGKAAIVLQDVVLLSASRDGNLLGDRQNVGKIVVRYLVHFSRMVLGNH